MDHEIKKSAPPVRRMTCIVCPVGCQLEVRFTENGAVKDVSGYTCDRGRNYAVEETQNPTRTLTSTVRISSAEESLLPVKTSRPIPKNRMMEAMRLIKALHIQAPVKIGDVIASDFVEKGTALVACKEILR